MLGFTSSSGTRTGLKRWVDCCFISVTSQAEFTSVSLLKAAQSQICSYPPVSWLPGRWPNKSHVGKAAMGLRAPNPHPWCEPWEDEALVYPRDVQQLSCKA